MKLQVKSDDGIDLISIQGDLDFHSSPQLRKELVQLVDNQSPKIMINLDKVGYIDSSGLATFVELYQKTKKYGGKFVLFSLTDAVRSVFEIAKLDSIFSLAKSADEAKTLVG